MTNKKEIKESYKEHWDIVESFVSSNGWLNTKKMYGSAGNTIVHLKLKGLNLECLDNYSPIYCYFFRPKRLTLIDNVKIKMYGL